MKITPHPSKPGLFLLAHPRYSPALLEAARHIPGIYRASVPSGCAIEGYSDALEAGVKWLVEARGLREDAFENTCEWAMSAKTKFNHSGMWYPERLREYQRDAVAFLLHEKRAILADDMGLGKSASAITAAMAVIDILKEERVQQDRKVLIVCPSYVRGVWSNPIDGGELKKWNIEGVLYECATTKAVIVPDYTTIVLCHYDILHAWRNVLSQWGPDIVIFDEAHYLTNPDSQRSKAARLISMQAEYVWGLTGTPMTNRPRDLWGVLSVIVPGRFGDPEEGFFRYGLRYCAAEKVQVTPIKTVWKFDGASHQEELRSRLRHFMLRRTKSEVALELPAKTRQVIRTNIEKKVRNAFVGAGAADNKAALRSALATAADAKLDTQAIPLIESHFAEGRRVVVFTYRKAVAEHIANALGGSHIHSGVSMARRGKLLADLRAGEGASLVAGTIDSMSTGIDLSYADVAVFVELTYEPHEFLQAEARLHRFGQKNPVLVQYLIAMGTADELILDMVVAKLDTFEAVIGGIAQEQGLARDLGQDEQQLMAELYRSLGL